MRTVVLLGALSLAAPASLAQTGTAPTADPPAASGQGTSAGPANICQELVAFMKAPPGAPGGDKPAGDKVAGDKAAGDKAAAKPGDGQAAGKSGSDAETSATPPAGESVPQKPQEETKSAEAASGQSGPAHAAPSQHSSAKSETGAHKAELKSSLSAPVPKDSESTPKTSVISVAKAEELAAANDLSACKAAAKDLRLAGVALPPPLLALAALDLKHQQSETPR